MTTKEIATRLAELCGKGEFETAQKELYAQDAISVEPNADTGFAKETKGLDAIIEKGKQFEGMVEAVHSCSTSAPMITDNAFAFTLHMDITMKGRGRTQMDEICVYEVKDGKVISEHFFY